MTVALLHVFSFHLLCYSGIYSLWCYNYSPIWIVWFSSVKMVSMCLKKPKCIYSSTSLRSFPSVAFEMVPVSIWLTMALSRPFKEDCLALILSDLPRSKPLVTVAVPTSLSAQSFAFILACPGQYTHRSFWRWISPSTCAVWASHSTFHCL